MAKIKIALLFQKYVRSMFKEVLPTHPDVEEMAAWHQAIGKLEDFDLIILGAAFAGLAPGERGYEPDTSNSHNLGIFDDGKYRNKTVIWDERADWNLWEWGTKRSFVYFKKSWPSIHRRRPDGPLIDPKSDWPPHVHYLAWPVLDLYTKIPTNLYKRDIDVGYYYGWLKQDRLTGERGRVMELIKTFDWGHDSCVELINTCGGAYQGHDQYTQEPMTGGRFNWWHVYMHFLRRTKILFTCPGYPNFFGADRRTAEAVSSGALVFTDKPHIQMPHPFEHGKHLFFFDPQDDKSINESLELAKAYLSPEKKEARESIANACVEHALTYHRSRNYVDYVMEIIKDELKKQDGI